jgi:AraC-like DNA-binding protein
MEGFSGTVAEVARRVGYRSDAAFSRAFRSRFGQSPRARRARQREGSSGRR